MTDSSVLVFTGSAWTSPSERQEAARDAYRRSVGTATPLTGTELGELFGRSARWGRSRIAEVAGPAAPDNEGGDDARLAASSVASNADSDQHGNGLRLTDDGQTGSGGPIIAEASASDLPGEPPPPSVAVQRTTTLAVLAVAAVAAIASFDHQRVLAEMAGEGWRSWLLPISVDGLVVAASMSLLVHRRARRPAGVLPWTAVLLGLGASLAANVLAADPSVVDPVLVRRIVAAWPPLALGVSFELFLGVLRHRPGHSSV